MHQILVNLNKLNLSYLDKWKLQAVAMTYNFVTFINVFNLCLQHIAVSGHDLQFCDIHKCFQSLSPAQLFLLSQVPLLVKLIALMPATNAVSERSASALRRVKTYLRSSMTQVHLHNMMVVHIHKTLTDTIDVK